MISQQLDRGSASEMATVVLQVGGLEQVRIRHGVYDINIHTNPSYLFKVHQIALARELHHA